MVKENQNNGGQMFRFWELLWVSESNEKCVIIHAKVMSHKEEKGSIMWEAACLSTSECHFVSMCHHNMGVSVTRTRNDTDITLQTVWTYLSLSLHLSQPSKNANVCVCL